MDGEVVISRPTAAEYLVFEGKHEAIIDQELWNAVQAKRGTIPPNPKANNFENPLAGILFCEKCNRRMSRRTYKDPATGKERSKARVACTDQRRCGTASATLEDVIKDVARELSEKIDNFKIRIEQGTDNSVEILRETVDCLNKRLEELRAEEIKQWDEKIKGIIPQHVFDYLNEKTLREIEEVKNELCTAENAIPEPIDLGERMLAFQNALDALMRDDVPAREKNTLLKDCIERIDYKRERVNGGHKRKGEEDSDILLHYSLKIKKPKTVE